MAVKSDLKTEHASSVEDELAELTALIPVTLHDLRSAVPAPMPMRDAMECASLGKRHASALLAVAAAEPISVSELAKRLGLLLSSTSTLVGELSNFLSIDDGQMKRRSARLRAARQRDAPGVAELVSAAYGHYVARIGRPPMCEDYAEVIRTRAVTIAEHAGSIVGVIVLAVT